MPDGKYELRLALGARSADPISIEVKDLALIARNDTREASATQSRPTDTLKLDPKSIHADRREEQSGKANEALKARAESILAKNHTSRQSPRTAAPRKKGNVITSDEVMKNETTRPEPGCLRFDL